MKNIIKKTVLAMFVAMTAISAYGQKFSSDDLPGQGSQSIGFSLNPVSGIRANAMFKAGDFVGNSLAAQGSSPYQMFILADPLVSLRYRYKVSDVMAVRASVGFSGAKFNYKEYVKDDMAMKDADDLISYDAAHAKVEDIIHYSMSGGGMSLGLEFTGGKGKLRFVGGIGLLYSFGGGSMKFTYGNKMDYDDNPSPTIMPIIKDSLGGKGTFWDLNLANARPVKRYDVGVVHAFGLTADAGIEWFIQPRMSVGASVSFTPLIYAVQPATYAIYEGISGSESEVVEVKKKISSGSNYLLYGTENIGLQLSLNYWF